MNNNIRVKKSRFATFLDSIKNFFKHQKEILLKSNIKTRSSYLIMGLGNILQKQIIKGLIFLSTQISFILIMIFFSAEYLTKFHNLGDVAQITKPNPSGGIPITEIVDYSPEILLFGVFSIVIIFIFTLIYISNIKSAYKCQKLIENGETPVKFSKEIKQFVNEKYHITLLSLPTLGVVLFTIIPLLFMILIAFTNYNRDHMPPGNLFTWVGFKNFANILVGTNNARTFWLVFLWTIIWAFFATFTNYIFGILLALLINKKGIRGKKVWRTIFIMTIAVPQFVSLLVMNQLLSDTGLINQMLQRYNIISEPIKFLSKNLNAKITVIVVNMWVGIPYTMLITSGLLMNIPTELYESAEIDGASPFKRLLHITTPYILFATAPYLITQFIGNINNFNVIFLLTGGGPRTDLNLANSQAGGTDLLVTWLYKLSIDHQNYDVASAIGVVIFIICAVISLIVYQFTSAVKHEGEMQ